MKTANQPEILPPILVSFTMHVHSCFASFASGDISLYYEYEANEGLDFILEKIGKQKYCDRALLISHSKKEIINNLQIIEFSVESVTINNKIHTLIRLYSEDKTLYNKELNGNMFQNKTKECQEIAQAYENKGWQKEHCATYDIFTQELDKINKTKESITRKMEDNVFPENFLDSYLKQDEKTRDVSDYQGGLSDKIFNHKFVQEYLRDGGLHGYLGVISRTKSLDRKVEAALLASDKKGDRAASWLTSSYGRHEGEGWHEYEDVPTIIDCMNKSFDLEG